MGADDERLVEHDGADAGHGADHHTEDTPLLEIGRRGNPAPRPCAESPGPDGAAGVGGVGLLAHRSHPALQSCSGTSPAASANWRRATTTDRWVLAGTADRRSAISWRRRSVTASTRSLPDLGQGDLHMASVVAVGPSTNETLLHQAVAQSRRGGRSDRDCLGQLGHALRPARGQDDEGAVLGEGDLLARVGQRASGDGHEDPAGAQDGVDHRVLAEVGGPGQSIHTATIPNTTST